MIGQTFTRLTVVSEVESRNGCRRWLCACSCGGSFVAKTGGLRSGLKRSCGCLWRERMRGEALSRFWEKVDKNGPIPEHRPDLGPCWVWTGGRVRNGYGMTHLPGLGRLAHVIAFVEHVGPVPEGLELDHLCRVRHCCNPKHLEPVTRRENIMRGDGPDVTRVRFAAITHCPAGHTYDAANTLVKVYAGGKTSRTCRACHAAAARKKKANAQL